MNIDLINELRNLALKQHYYCEDEWYSCPKHPNGCFNDKVGQDCNCGADKHNNKVNEIYNKLMVELNNESLKS